MKFTCLFEVFCESRLVITTMRKYKFTKQRRVDSCQSSSVVLDLLLHVLLELHRMLDIHRALWVV